jgi:norsolorinic acid ketoreductase
MTYNVLITGANKGIGYGLVAKYLSRPDTTVIATVRQPSSPEATRLNELPKGEGSNIIIVKIESTSETDAQEAVSSLGGHHINHLDLVIANSGLFALHAFVEVSKIQTKDLIDHFNVNTAGTVRLFQATLPLLQKAEKPIFAYMSSGVGSISLQEHFAPPIGNYGASKAAMNLLIRRIHIENPDLIAVALHPG